jgi:hypothetical protein
VFVSIYRRSTNALGYPLSYQKKKDVSTVKSRDLFDGESSLYTRSRREQALQPSN